RGRAGSPTCGPARHTRRSQPDKGVDSMARITVVATGGTIANTLAGRVSMEEVLADIARAHPSTTVEGLAELEIDEVLRDGAEAFTPHEWLVIGRGVQRAVDQDDVTGVVVTHGTYTAEETAYFL